MNKKQRKLLICALILSLGLVLYPPWKYEKANLRNPDKTIFVLEGHYPIFSPPDFTSAKHYRPNALSSSIDYSRTLFYFLGLAIVFLILFIVFNQEKKPISENLAAKTFRIMALVMLILYSGFYFYSDVAYSLGLKYLFFSIFPFSLFLLAYFFSNKKIGNNSPKGPQTQ